MKQEKKVLGRFPLSECTGVLLADEDKIKRPFGFEIVTPERTFLLCASNENEVGLSFSFLLFLLVPPQHITITCKCDQRDDWMEALEDCIPEAGTITQTEELAQEEDFDHEEEGQSDEEDDTPELSSYSLKANARKSSRKRKRLTVAIDIVSLLILNNSFFFFFFSDFSPILTCCLSFLFSSAGGETRASH